MSEQRPEWTIEQNSALIRITRGLQEFGYPSVTREMVEECVLAVRLGKAPPHGVIGLFIEGVAKRETCFPAPGRAPEEESAGG
jgi:hypothetical protein